MSALFLKVLNLSINASWLIMAVIAARLLIKKAPKWISCLLWGLVAIRLICPFSLESALSLLPSGNVVPGNIEKVQNPHIYSGVRIIDHAVNPVIEGTLSPKAGDSVNPMQAVVSIASMVWLVGLAVMLFYALISVWILKRKVRASLMVSGRVRECDEVRSPFILGIIRPVIYVPSGMNDKTLELVTAHEEAHLKRHDHWWKPLGFILLSIYWFHPLCWIAYVLLCRDIEAACDEKVIKDKDREYVASYSQALLDCSNQRRVIAACPLAFGETGVKGRIKGVLNYKKPAFWVKVASVICCIAVALCFLTNPLSAQAEDELMQFLRETVLENSKSLYDEGDYHCCDIEIMGIRTNGNRKTVYAWVLEEMYINNDGKTEDVSGSHIPAAITVRKTDTGYILSEFWIPKDGADYVSSIHSKFPFILWSKAVDSQKYIGQQQIRCDAQAKQHYQSLGETGNGGNQDCDSIIRPVVNLSDTEGADLTELLYADKNRIIFSGSYGLFVYSKAQRAITNAIDLEPIGCNFTQGDNYCEKFVSADGNTVYLHPVSDTDMYVYDILSDTLSQEKYNLEGRDLHVLQHNEEGEIFDVWKSEDHQIETHLHHRSFIGELGYVEYGQSSGDKLIPYYPFFLPDGLSGAVDFAPEDVHDIVAADIWVAGELSHMPGVFDISEGQSRRLHCEDPAVLKELEKAFSGATKEKAQSGCPFYTALCLTRSDGTIGTVFPATDSCDMYVSGKACYRMAEGTNEKLWGLINGFQEIEGWKKSASTEKSENLGIQYTFEDGSYVVDGGRDFQYKKELIGRNPNARYGTRYIVLTNDPDITFEKVDRSIYSSNSADWLYDTIIIGMSAIQE